MDIGQSQSKKYELISHNSKNDLFFIIIYYYAISSKMRELENLIAKADSENKVELVKELLYLCNKIYYIGRSVYYNGVAYDLNDLPPDSFFDKMWVKHMPKGSHPGQELSEDLLNKADEKVKNPNYIMYRLDKIKRDDFEKMKIFDTYDKLFVSAKMDGMSLQCRFKNGKLVQAITRYQHDLGIDQTRKALRFLTFPDTKVCPSEFIVTGEVLFKGDGYNEVLSEKGEPYKNRRAAAAGLIGRDYNYDGDDKILNNLYFVAFDCPYAEGIDFETEEEKFEFLKKLSFEIPAYEIIEKDKINPDYLESRIEAYKQMYLTKYDIDGIVISPMKYFWENEEVPKLKIAFKFKYDEIMQTEVIEIISQVGRTGRIVPVIIVKPVKLANTDVDRITGSNYSEVKDRKIMVGSIVGVIKSGTAIPYIETIDNSKLPKEQEPIIPEKCPICEVKAEWKKIVKGKGRDLICPNNECPSRYQNVVNFFRTLGLEGFDQKMFDILNLGSIEEAFELDEYKLSRFEGFGSKRASDFYNGIRKCITDAEQSTYLAACSIDGISEKTAQTIIKAINIEKIFCLKEDIPKTYEEWKLGFPKIKGIADAKLTKIWEKLKFVKALTLHLIEIGLTFKAEVVVVEKENITGKTFVLTGSGSKSREEYSDLIRNFGGKITNKISGKTDYLVTNDPKGSNSKNVDAKTFGVNIIGYDILDKWLV